MYINGEDCKRNFIMYYNNQKYEDLLPNSKKFVKELFPNIVEEDVIKCRYINNGKVDIEIVFKNDKRRIMIKSGKNSVIHIEDFESFCNFLREIKVANYIINLIKKVHFSNDIDALKAEKRVISEYLEKPRFLNLFLKRILCDDYYHKEIDYLYYGNVLSGKWIKVNDLKKTLLNYKNNHSHSALRIANIKMQRMILAKNDNFFEDRCVFSIWNILSCIKLNEKDNIT